MRRTNLGLAVAGLVAALAISGGQCVRAARPARSSQGGQDDQKSVQSIDVPNHELMVDGDDVPGYMDAMSMPYSVPDERALKALTVGDIIRADIVVHGDDAHLENIKVTGHAKPKGQ